MLNYPTALPLDAVQKLIEIFKAKAVQTRKAEFGLAAWNIQGFAQSMLLGNPVVGDVNQEDFSAAIEELAKEVVAYNNAGITFTAENEQEALDLNSILTVLTVLMELLKSLGILKFKEQE